MLSSPSGGGKTTIARALLAARDDVAYSISATTRPRRAQERDGIDYDFLTPDQFQRKVDAGEFLEWAVYGGHRYGTVESAIRGIVASGKHAVLDIEVVEATEVRKRLANVVSVFILPPSAKSLIDRLAGRSTEGPEALAARVQHAVEEVGAAADYDYVVVNDDREDAVAEIHGIIEAEGRRTARQNRLPEKLEELRDALIEEAQLLQR